MTAFHAPDVAAAEAVAVLMTEVSEGRLTAATMADRAAARCREVFGQCDGPTDPLWSVHVDICRAVLGHGGLPASELAQWTAAARSGENTGPAMDYPPVPDSAASEAYGDDVDGSEPMDDGRLRLVAAQPETVDAIETLDDDDEFADVPDAVLIEAEAASMAVIEAYRRRREETPCE